MSKECPNGHGRQPIIGNVTVDMKTPVRASDVIAFKLKCGCIVGGEEYKAFAEEVQKLKESETKAVSAIQKKFANLKATAYKTFAAQEDLENGTE